MVDLTLFRTMILRGKKKIEKKATKYMHQMV